MDSGHVLSTNAACRDSQGWTVGVEHAGVGSEAAMATLCHVDSWAPPIKQHRAPVIGAAIAGPPATSAPLLDR